MKLYKNFKYFFVKLQIVYGGSGFRINYVFKSKAMDIRYKSVRGFFCCNTVNFQSAFKSRNHIFIKGLPPLVALEKGFYVNLKNFQ